jgi:hypothetical protein
MKEFFGSLLTSKKFVAAIVAVIIFACGKLGWNVDEAALMAWISPLLAFIVGQGLADHGKDAVKEANKAGTLKVADISGPPSP